MIPSFCAIDIMHEPIFFPFEMRVRSEQFHRGFQANDIQIKFAKTVQNSLFHGLL